MIIDPFTILLGGVIIGVIYKTAHPIKKGCYRGYEYEYDSRTTEVTEDGDYIYFKQKDGKEWKVKVGD
jgi:hypothetical protein